MTDTADIVFLIIAAGFISIGTYRGLSGEIISLVSFLGGSYLALNFPHRLSEVLVKQIGMTPFAAKAAAIFLIFIGTYMLTQLLGKGIKKFIRISRLTLADRLAGFCSGLLKAYSLFLLVFVILTLLSPIFSPKWVKTSVVMQQTAATWPFVLPILEKNDLLPKVDTSETLKFIDALHSPQKAKQQTESSPKKKSVDLTPQTSIREEVEQQIQQQIQKRIQEKVKLQ